MLPPYLRHSIDEDMKKKEKSRALLDILMISPKEYYDEFCEIIAGLHPTIFQLLKERNPTSQESGRYLEPFCDKLRQGILSMGRNLTDNDIDPKIDLDTQFVSLKLKHQHNPTQRLKKPSYFENEDNIAPNYYEYNLDHSGGKDLAIEEIIPEESAGKGILITGRAGIGKSTLIQFLNRQWAKKHWATSHTVVFLLNLRRLVHIQSKVTLGELFGMYAEYTLDPPDSSQPSVEWLKNNQEKILLFTDGIDELADLSRLFRDTRKLPIDKEGTPLEWCINLMRRNVLQQSTMLMISRPFKGLEELQYDVHIDVLGLVPEKVMQFVELNVRKARQEVVKDTLRQNPVLLSICSITFYCAALSKIFEEDEKVDVSGLTTYTRITAFILSRLAARRGKSETASLVLSDHLAKCLPHLAALAYRGLSGDTEKLTRLVFEGRDFIATKFSHKEIQQARETGLLVCRDMKDPMNETETKLQAEFVHLSMSIRTNIRCH